MIEFSKMRSAISKHAPLIVAGVIVLLISIRMLVILAGGDLAIVQHVGDDSFYYFVPARNYAETGFWSFDGVASTTGFHLLWAYNLVLLFLVDPSINLAGLFIFASTIGAICYAASVWLLAKLVQRLYGTMPTLAVLLVYGTVASMRIATMAMEAPYVILFASAVAYLTLTPRPADFRPSFKLLSLAFVCGVLGMLSRSDFGLFPLMIFGVLLARDILSRSISIGRLAVAFSALAGSVVGLLLVLAHCYAISDSIFQNSARMKAYWSILEGRHLMASFVLLSEMFTDQLFSVRKLALGVFVLLSGAGFYSAWRRSLPLAPLVAAAAIILGYLLFYRYNSDALQIWYLASFMPAAAILIAPAMLYADRWRVPMAGLAGIWAAAGLLLSLNPLWPFQQVFREAGLEIRDNKAVAHVGAWNAGIIRYYAGRPVTNLDGLVNDDILPYAQKGRLADYVLKRGLTHIMDLEVMFGGKRAVRGGYGDGRLRRCLNISKKIGKDEPSQLVYGTRMTLYSVDRACLVRIQKGLPAV